MSNIQGKPDEDGDLPNDPRGQPRADAPPANFSLPSDPSPGGQAVPPNETDAEQRDRGNSQRGLPTPAHALWGNLTDLFNNATIPDRARNAFSYGEIVGRTLHGWRIKLLSFLFSPGDATKLEIATIRGTIKGIGRGLVFVAPLSAIVDLADVFRENRIGSGAFYQKYGMAGLGAVGGILGGAAFDAFGFGILASLGLTGVGLFVAAPIAFGLLGAGAFQALGAAVNQQTEEGSFAYRWYAGSFIDRAVSSVWSWLVGQSPGDGVGQRQTASGTYRPRISTAEEPARDHADPGSNSRRRPPQPGVPYPPDRRGPDSGAFATENGNDGEGGSGTRGTRDNASVGGILFDDCGTVLTDIETLTGAYWDATSQSVVLMGLASEDTSAKQIELAAMDADHLKVALRAAIMGEALGVSIDAPAGYRFSATNEMPPTGTPFFVSYFGGCERTLAGAIFFESDRIMKCLSLGRDNETQHTSEAQVPGFRSSFDLHRVPPSSEGGPSWHRFWFVIDRVELRRATEGDAIVFGEVKIAVRTEIDFRESEAGLRDDPLDAQFARHLTSNYDAYATEFPVLGRLKELAKISALARFLIDQGVDLDLGDLLDYLPAHVPTPETTPSLVRSEVSRADGSVRTFSMSGGVDFRVDPLYREDIDGIALGLREIALANAATGAIDWTWRSDSGDVRGLSIGVGSRLRKRLLETDHEFPRVGKLHRLRLQRIYELKGSTNGMFGPDWRVFIPWSLTILHGSGKRPEVVEPKYRDPSGSGVLSLALRYGRSGSVQIYRPLADVQVNGCPAWGRVRVGHRSRRSAGKDESDVIYLEDGHFVMDRNSHRRRFDRRGRLVEITSESGVLTKYVWLGDRLEKIESQTGQSYSFVYAVDSNTVASVRTSDGETLDYSYGSDSYLSSVISGSRYQYRYSYDLMQRLHEVRDASGTVSRRFYYGGGDLPVKIAGSDEVRVLSGGLATRTFVEGRLAAITEEAGGAAQFSYNMYGHLQSVFVHNRENVNWRLEYGGNGKPRRFVGPLGQATEVKYDDGGIPVGAILPNGVALTVRRDNRDGVVEIAASGEQDWKASYDMKGLLRSLSGRSLAGVTVRRRPDLISIKLDCESCGQTRGPISLFHTGPTHRNSGISTSRRVPGRHRVKRTVASDGRSMRIDGPTGGIQVLGPAVTSATEVVEFS